MSPVPAKRGQRLGPYVLDERLGSGGMAEVYLARRDGPYGFAKRHAIKKILPQLSRDPRFVAMFCDEARICAALMHPNIVQVVDFGEVDGELFMAMEYVEGTSCAKLLRLAAKQRRRFPVAAAVFVAHEILRGLHFAHHAVDRRGRSLGIVHRDVSPGNVLIGRAGEVKLTDFGIVQSSFVDRRTYPGELKGKLGYMSPEQTAGSSLDPRSDIFSAGILLAEMLIARPLFPGRSEMDVLTRIFEADLRVLVEFRDTIDSQLFEILGTALARRPDDRFSSAREFADALADFGRRRGMALNDSALVPWLSELGAIKFSSGTRNAIRTEHESEDIEGRAERVAKLVRATLPQVSKPEPLSAAKERYFVGRQWLTLPGILGRVASGKLRGKESLARPDGDSLRTADIPQAAMLLRRPAFAFGEPRWLGRGAAFSRAVFVQTLYQVVHKQRTCLVLLRHRDAERRLFFEKGLLSFASSTAESELLGECLVRAGKLRREQVDFALSAAHVQALPLGRRLFRAGWLTEGELERALQRQVVQRFIAASAWTTGQLAVLASQSPDRVRLPARVKASWITRLVREGYSAAQLAECLKGAWSSPVVPHPAPAFSVDELGMNAREHRLFAQLALPSTLASMIEASGDQSEGVLRVLFCGLCAGLLVAPGFVFVPFEGC